MNENGPVPESAGGTTTFPVVRLIKVLQMRIDMFRLTHLFAGLQNPTIPCPFQRMGRVNGNNHRARAEIDKISVIENGSLSERKSEPL